MADPLTDGQIAEWRRYLDQGDWHQLVTDDEFRALLDTAAEVALLRELVGYDKVTLNTILEEHHAEAGKLAEEVARLRAEVKNLTAERDLARSNYEITRLAEAERLLQDLRPVLQTGAWGDMIAAFLARTTPKADVTINGLGVSSWADHADKTPNEELSAGAKEVAVEVEGYL